MRFSIVLGFGATTASPQAFEAEQDEENRPSQICDAWAQNTQVAQQEVQSD